MNVNKISLSHLESFILIAELKHLSQVAEKLGVTKAAISQSLKLLENEVGSILFDRSTRKMELTEVGQLLYKESLGVKASMESLKSAISGLQVAPKGVLRIMANPIWAETFLLEKIQSYLLAFPDMQVELLTDERVPSMKMEKIDLVFGVTWEAPLDVVRKKIGETRYVLVGSPDYFKRQGKPEKKSDLKSQVFIHHAGRELSDLRAVSKLSMNQVSLLKSAALKGMGLIQVHEYAVLEELKKGLLIEVVPGFFKSEEPVFLYYAKPKFVQPKVREFLKLLGL